MTAIFGANEVDGDRVDIPGLSGMPLYLRDSYLDNPGGARQL